MENSRENGSRQVQSLAALCAMNGCRPSLGTEQLPSLHKHQHQQIESPSIGCGLRMSMSHACWSNHDLSTPEIISLFTILHTHLYFLTYSHHKTPCTLVNVTGCPTLHYAERQEKSLIGWAFVTMGPSFLWDCICTIEYLAFGLGRNYGRNSTRYSTPLKILIIDVFLMLWQLYASQFSPVSQIAAFFVKPFLNKSVSRDKQWTVSTPQIGDLVKRECQIAFLWGPRALYSTFRFDWSHIFGHQLLGYRNICL